MTGERREALIIANSEYTDGKLGRLSAPEIDAKSLRNVLFDPQIGYFDDVRVLSNEESQDVREAIEAFFSNRRSKDTLLLYFSGHGVLDPRGNLFLATTNTQTQKLYSTGVSARFISEILDNSQSKRQILVLDCCYSGAFDRGGKMSIERPVEVKGVFQEQSGRGRIILTATDSTQNAWEGDELIQGYVNSRFTFHLVEGLRTGEADRHGNGVITIQDLYKYVYEKVLEDGSDKKPQTPQMWADEVKGRELIIARNLRKYPKNKYPLPYKAGDSIDRSVLRKVLTDVFEYQIETIAFDLGLDAKRLGDAKQERIFGLVREGWTYGQRVNHTSRF